MNYFNSSFSWINKIGGWKREGMGFDWIFGIGREMWNVETGVSTNQFPFANLRETLKVKITVNLCGGHRVI